MPLNLYKGQAQEKNARLRPARFVVAIGAGKGGVGKSTLCANLALCLRLKGYQVGVLDADIYGPSQRRMIREDRLPIEKQQHLEPALAQGIQLISLAHFRSEQEACAFRAPIANKLIEQFLLQVNWQNLDYLLIDLPPGTGDIPLTLTQKGFIQTSVLISTPQAVATQDVNKCIDLFEQVSVPILGIVENMTYLEVSGQKIYPFGQSGVQKLAAERGYPVLASLPLCPELSDACECGVPFVLTHPKHSLTQQLLHVAERLIEECENPHQGCEPLKYVWR